MGLYDQLIPAFDDLRDHEVLKTRHGRRPSKYGIEPEYQKDVERVVEHIAQVRRTMLPPGTHVRIGTTWRRNIRDLLRGSTPAGMMFTADQLCDLFDFAAQDHFWRGPVSDPEGLARQAHKLWFKTDFTSWSLRNGRPSSNRPDRSTAPQARPKGQLAADETGKDYGKPEEWFT